MTSDERITSIAHALDCAGTIPTMLAKTIGIALDKLLTWQEQPHSIDHAHGWFAVRTCSREKFREIAAENVGNMQFWLGVAKAQWLKERGI